jgi:uncharacterized repeat protein (TIGR03803 family)
LASPRQHRIPVFWSNLRAANTVRTLTIAFVLTVVATQAAQATTFNVIYTFTSGNDGTTPNAGLTIDTAGNLYGTTLAGAHGYGTVFKLAKAGSNWTLTTLYSFTGGNDGASPRSKVIIGPDGNLYGVTSAGGGSGCGGRGCGTIFTVRKGCPAPICSWTESVLYRFTGGTDGGVPIGNLLFDPSGNLYGTTEIGGKPHGCGNIGCGTVFKLTKSGRSWTETVLYEFQGGSDGAFPNGAVIFDTSGNLYGTTCCGTSHNAGTVFELTPAEGGWSEKLLYVFQGSSDGKEPDTALIFDNRGNLYGSTIFGGTGRGGTVFELTRAGDSWTFSVLYSPRGNIGPDGTLILDAVGNLYGTTQQDGEYLLGSAFKLTPSGGSWTYTSFHDFTGGNDGDLPESSLVFDRNGNLYGTAAYGGANGDGVIIEITP